MPTPQTVCHPNPQSVTPIQEAQQGRILYLEDEKDLINMIQLVLSRQGYEVVGTDTVANAIATLKEQRFDLVFVDLNLENGSGWDLIEHLKQNGGHTSLAKVIVTAQTLDQKSRTETGYGICYDEIVNKPFPINTLISVTKRLLDKPKPLH